MLLDLEVKRFLDELASDLPTPGGGSAAALAAAQAAALAEMAVALTLKSEKHAASHPVLEPMRSRAAELRRDLSALVDRDAEAYEQVLQASRLPRRTEEEKAARKEARDRALRFAAEVPLETAELASQVATLAAQAAPHVNPNAASDLLVAVLLAQASLDGAAANVRINLDSLKSEGETAKVNERLVSWRSSAATSVDAVRRLFPSLS